MERRKKLAKTRTRRGKSIEEDGARVSISVLPVEILMDIQSRLSVKSIFRCRSVCKCWLQILLTHDFAQLHFSRAPTCPLLHNPNGRTISKALYLLEIERDRLCYVCDDDNRRRKKLCASYYRDNEKHANMKISTRFLLPNLESKDETKCEKRKFTVVNSCRGFLCLRGSLLKDPIVIYNPVTSEYTIIPSPVEDEFTTGIIFGGLGFCQRIKKYKVLVMLRKWYRNPPEKVSKGNLALVYTVGSGIWRTVGNAPRAIKNELTNPTFLNGALHWLVGDYKFDNIFLVYFDLDYEHFKSMLPPDWNTMNRNFQIESTHLDRLFQDKWSTTNFSDTEKKRIGVLNDQIFVCDTNVINEATDVWALKDYSDQQSWFKRSELSGLPPGLYHPITLLEDGDLLLHQENNAFVTCDEYNFKYFKILGFRTKFQVTPHVPSFLSLKEVVGDDMEVLIVRPSEFPKDKTSQLRLVEENWESMPDYWGLD